MNITNAIKYYLTARSLDRVGWLEFNVPFQHKYGYITDKSLDRKKEGMCYISRGNLSHVHFNSSIAMHIPNLKCLASPVPKI